MDFVEYNDMMKFRECMGAVFESSTARHAVGPNEAMCKVCETSRVAGNTIETLFGRRIKKDGGGLNGDIDAAMAEAKAVFGMAQMLCIESYVAGRAIALEKARRDRAKEG